MHACVCCETTFTTSKYNQFHKTVIISLVVQVGRYNTYQHRVPTYILWYDRCFTTTWVKSGEKKKIINKSTLRCAFPPSPDIRFLCRLRNSEIGYHVIWRYFLSSFKLDPNKHVFSLVYQQCSTIKIQFVCR